MRAARQAGYSVASAQNTKAMPEMRIAGWPLGMAVKAEHRELVAALSNALAELQRTGALSRIFAAHGITHQVP